MKAKEVMKKYNICRATLCRWVKFGRISFEKLPSGRYDYVEPICKYQAVSDRKNVIYGRVSSTTQSENLPRQVERVRSFASANGLVVDEVYSEVASALNYGRKKYRKLYKEVVEKKIDKIFIEYKDRLLRIGFEDFEELCNIHGSEIIVVDKSDGSDKTKQQEITDDLISIIHHFSSKIYSTRRVKKITDTIKGGKDI